MYVKVDVFILYVYKNKLLCVLIYFIIVINKNYIFYSKIYTMRWKRVGVFLTYITQL